MTIIVTGGSRGIGRAIVMECAKQGMDVAFTYKSGHAAAEETLVLVGAEAPEAQVKAYQADVTDEEACKKLVADVEADLGPVAGLVNNAGIGYLMKPITDMDVSEWDAVQGVNLRGAFLCIKHAARAMQAQGRGGRIINIASQAAKSGFPHAAAYCSSKHGVVGLTRVAALELGPHGITVNAVCPNHVTTGLGAWQNEYFAKLSGQSVEEYLAAMRGRIPLGRPGKPDDTAAACAFLCSDDAAYITGEAMNVSGGEETH